MIDWKAKKLDVFVWDVSHGLSVTIITPFVGYAVGGVYVGRRRVIQIDAGVNKQFNFSPITHLVNNRGLQVIDCLVLSHVDKDHIDELPNILSLMSSGKLEVISLIRNRSVPNSSISEVAAEETAAKTAYKNINNAYVGQVQNHDLLHPLNFSGVQVQTTHLHYAEGFQEPNNLSVVASIKFGSTQIVVPGDLEERGAELLINLDWMPSADPNMFRVLLAPHHGSYTAKPAKLLKFFKPCITLASAEENHEYSDPLYSSPDYVSGHPVMKSNGVEEVCRFNATKGEAIHLETYGHYPHIKRMPYRSPLPKLNPYPNILTNLLINKSQPVYPSLADILKLS